MTEEEITEEVRELHEYVRQCIQEHLGSRSWSWLADAAGISRVTLNTEAAQPYFSVDSLVHIARALGQDIEAFLPPQEKH